MRTFIANKKSFYEITEIIPNLLRHWEEIDGLVGKAEKDAIESLKQKFKCTHVVQAKEFNDETVRKILQARRQRR